jgi:hypothetical protein
MGGCHKGMGKKRSFFCLIMGADMWEGKNFCCASGLDGAVNEKIRFIYKIFKV